MSKAVPREARASLIRPVGPARASRVAQRAAPARIVMVEWTGRRVNVTPRTPPTGFPIAWASPNVAAAKGAADDGSPLRGMRRARRQPRWHGDRERIDASWQRDGRDRRGYSGGRKVPPMHSFLPASWPRLSPIAAVAVSPAPGTDPWRMPFVRPNVGRRERGVQAAPIVRPVPRGLPRRMVPTPLPILPARPLPRTSVDEANLLHRTAIPGRRDRYRRSAGCRPAHRRYDCEDGTGDGDLMHSRLPDGSTFPPMHPCLSDASMCSPRSRGPHRKVILSHCRLRSTPRSTETTDAAARGTGESRSSLVPRLCWR